MLVLDGQTDTDSQLTERDRPCSDDGLILVSGIGTDPGSCLVESDCACAHNGLLLVSDIGADPDSRLVEDDCACAHNGLLLMSDVGADPGSCLAEGDCTCSDDSPVLARTAPRSRDTLSYRLSLCNVDSLVQDYYLAFNPLSQAGAIVFNQRVLALLNTFQQPRTLPEGVRLAGDPPNGLQMARRLAHLGLLEPVDSHRQPKRTNPQTLTVWLHLTNACNLRCTYCYLTKTNEAMDTSTGRAAIDAVFRSAIRHQLKAVKLKYAGGEPTLNFRLVRALHEHARSLAASHGLELHEVVLSNGVALSNPMLDFMRGASMRLAISLDGLGATHDTQRRFANGCGSAHMVARSVDRALAKGIKPHLSITVTNHNADRVADAVAFALERDLLFNLNFYRENDRAIDPKSLVAEDARLIAGVRAAFKVIEERLPRRSLMATLVDRANFISPHDRPCGVSYNYLVIDPRGRVARCQMEIEHAVTDVWAEDLLDAVRNRQVGFQNVAVDEKEGCTGCAWRYYCAGGCPLLTYRSTGRSDVKSPYCNVYRALYPDVLKLEGLRLLKWGAQGV